MNLIANSTFQNGAGGNLILPVVRLGSGTITVTVSDLDVGVPANYLHIIQATDDTGFYMDVSLKANTQYVFSFYARALIGDRLWYKMTDDQTGLAMYSGEIMLSNKVTRYQFTGITGPMTKSTRVSIYAASGTGYSFDIAAIQVEEGSAATPFHINEGGVLTGLSNGVVGNLAAIGNIDIAGNLRVTGSVNAVTRCQYTYAGGMIISIGGGGVIPFPTVIEDTASMRDWSVLSTADGDTNTLNHLLDADGTNWTTIDGILAPLLFPVHNIDDDTWAVANSVAAHDITLSSDIFPTGVEAYEIRNPSFYINVNGLYLIDVSVQLAATEADKNYKLDVIADIATPVIIATEQFDAASTGPHIISLTRLVQGIGGGEIYVKISHTGVGTLTLGYCFLTIVKL